MNKIIKGYFKLADVVVDDIGFKDVKFKYENGSMIKYTTYIDKDNTSTLVVKKDKENNTMQVSLLKKDCYSHKILFKKINNMLYAIKGVEQDNDLYSPLDESSETIELIYSVKDNFKVTSESDMEELVEECHYRDNIGTLYLEEKDKERAILLGNILGYEDITKNKNGDYRVEFNSSDFSENESYSTIEFSTNNKSASIKIVDQNVTNVKGDCDVESIQLTNYENIEYDFCRNGEVVDVCKKDIHLATFKSNINGISEFLGLKALGEAVDEVIASYPISDDFSFDNNNDVMQLVMTSIKKDISNVYTKEKK